MDLLSKISKRLVELELERNELLHTLAILAKTNVVTYVEIGEVLGISRQAARQMCVRLTK